MAGLEDVQKKFIQEISQVDDMAQIVLKGHLLMEDLMTQALETYLLHGEFVEVARLQFHQKLTLCRSISTSEHKNNMWSLMSEINGLRNALSHSLEPERRKKSLQKLTTVYEQEFKKLENSKKGIPNEIEGDFPHELAVCMYSIAGCLGFLHSFLEEVKRLKELIVALDAVMNKGDLSKPK